MIKPLVNNVLLKKQKQEKEIKVNGIYLKNDNNQENKNLATVIAISKNLKNNKDLDFTEENIVLYKEYAGTEFEYNDEKYILIDFESILAVISE